MRILIAENDSDIRMLLGLFFNGEDGIEAYVYDSRSEYLFDERNWEGVELLITDWMMSPITGPMLVKYVQSAYPHIDILIYSAMEFDAIKASEDEINFKRIHHATKGNVTMAELVGVVRGIRDGS